MNLPPLAARIALLDALLEREARMLEELAQVAALVPADMPWRAPRAAFGTVAGFVDTLDPATIGPDGRVWLLNRLALYLARWFMARHGGMLVVQGDPRRRFHLHFVLAGMLPPVRPGARLDVFGLADAALAAGPREGLAALAASAEAALTAPEGPPRAWA